MFEKTDENDMLVATDLMVVNQDNILNMSLLNERVVKENSENQKLKNEIIGLKEEIRKRIKVNDHLILLKENILEEQEQLHDVKVECFTKIQNIADIIKALERHLENASKINKKIEFLWVKI